MNLRTCEVAPSRARAFTLAATLDEAARVVPAELVSRPALRRVRTLTAHLPAALTRTFYLELRLHAGDDRTDLIIEIDETGREILARANPVQSLARTRAGPIWRALERFCVEWRAAHPLVQRLWLEFDVGSDARHTLSAPGVFLNFRHDSAHADTLNAHATVALRALAPTLSPITMDTVAQCLAALPPGAFVPYVGVFAARSADTVRVCIQDVELDALVHYLERIDWRGDGAAVARTVAELTSSRSGCETPGPSLVHLDIAHAPLPTLGLEFALARRAQVRGLVAEQPFLDHLLHAELTTPAKHAALAAVPSCALTQFPHQLWRSVLVRQVNHIKVVFDAAGNATAKAYLLFGTLPYPLERPLS